jgi:SM-20-related protein
MANKWDIVIDELVSQGYSIQKHWLEPTLVEELLKAAHQHEFKAAGVGEGRQHQIQQQVRANNISWLDPLASTAEASFLQEMNIFCQKLNQALFVSLQEYEAQFGHYPIGGYYKKHLDQFNNNNSRKISTVYYLNDNWLEHDGGELVIYDLQGQELAKVMPEANTFVSFLSDQFPHEVLPAKRERWCIAGWFRTRKITI